MMVRIEVRDMKELPNISYGLEAESPPLLIESTNLIILFNGDADVQHSIAHWFQSWCPLMDRRWRNEAKLNIHLSSECMKLQFGMQDIVSEVLLWLEMFNEFEKLELQKKKLVSNEVRRESLTNLFVRRGRKVKMDCVFNKIFSKQIIYSCCSFKLLLSK